MRALTEKPTKFAARDAPAGKHEGTVDLGQQAYADNAYIHSSCNRFFRVSMWSAVLLQISFKLSNECLLLLAGLAFFHHTLAANSLAGNLFYLAVSVFLWVTLFLCGSHLLDASGLVLFCRILPRLTSGDGSYNALIIQRQYAVTSNS